MNGQRLRPLGVGDIFDEGFDLYKRNFVFLLLTAALILVPLDFGVALATPRLLPPLYDLFGVSTSAADASGATALRLLLDIVFALPLSLVASAPLVAACAALYLDRPVTLRQVYGHCLRRLPGLLVAVGLACLALDVGLAFCFVGGAVVATLYLFSLHALLMEGRSGVGALKRSAALVSGHGSRIFGCLILLNLISWAISLGLSLPLDYFFSSVLKFAPASLGPLGDATTDMTTRGLLVHAITSGLGDLLLTPFLVCVVTALYYDLRVRKEGYDVDLMAEDLKYPPLTALGPFLPPVAVYLPPRPIVTGPPPPRSVWPGGPR